MMANSPSDQTNWTVEEDLTCKKLVAQAGGGVVGFGSELLTEATRPVFQHSNGKLLNCPQLTIALDASADWPTL